MSDSYSPRPARCPPFCFAFYNYDVDGTDELGHIDPYDKYRQRCEAALCEADEEDEDRVIVEYTKPTL